MSRFNGYCYTRCIYLNNIRCGMVEVWLWYILLECDRYDCIIIVPIIPHSYHDHIKITPRSAYAPFKSKNVSMVLRFSVLRKNCFNFFFFNYFDSLRLTRSDLLYVLNYSWWYLRINNYIDFRLPNLKYYLLTICLRFVFHIIPRESPSKYTCTHHTLNFRPRLK